MTTAAPAERDLATTLLSCSTGTWLSGESGDGLSPLPDAVDDLPLALAGQRLADRYQLQQPVGQGGFGEVWRALDVQHDRPCAIKLIRLRAADATLGRRFLFEVLASGVAHHDNLVSLRDHGRTGDGRLFLVFDFLAGCSLAELLAERGRQPPAHVARLGAQVAAGLSALHGADVVHRDLKPGNVFLVGGQIDGVVKIVDFGLARLPGAGGQVGSGPGAPPAGTPTYMSPEQIRGEPASPLADLYALGCLLHAVASGAAPFTGSLPAVLDAQQNLAPPPLPAAVLAQPGGPALAELIGRLLAKSPSARPPSAAAVRASLLAIAAATAEENADVAAPARPTDAAVGEPGASYVAGWSPGVPRFDGLFRGRQSEQARLVRWLVHFSETAGLHLCWLSGVEGIGRSTLSRWLAERVAGDRDMRLLRVPGSDAGAAPMAALRRLLSDALAMLNPDPETALAAVFERLDSVADAATTWQRAALARLLNGQPQNSSLDEDGADGHRLALLAAIGHAVVAASEGGPLVLIADDLERAPPLLQQALGAAVAGATTRPAHLGLVLVCRTPNTTRPIVALRRALRSASTRGQVPLLEMELGPLAPETCRALLTEVGSLEDPLANRLVAWSGGNPGLLQQALRAMIAGGWLQWRATGWVAVPGWRPPEVLDRRLDALLGAELDHLLQSHGGAGSATDRLLRLLALAEGPLDVDVLRSALARLHDDDAPGFEDAAAALLGAGLVRRRVADGALGLRHARLADLVCDRLPGPPSARQLHAALADALVVAEPAADVALPHLWAAGRVDAAWRATGRCLDRVVAARDHDSAVELLRLALEHGHELEPDAVAAARQTLGGVLLTLGRSAEAAEVFEALLAGVGDLSDTDKNARAAGAWLGLARAAEAQINLPRSLTCLEAALSKLPDDDVATLARIELLRGQVLTVSGRSEAAAEALRRARRAAQATEQPTVAARAQVEEAFIAVWSNRLTDALSLLEGPVLRRPDLDPFVAARCAFVRAAIHDQRGELAAATEAGEVALRLVRQLGHRRAEASTLLSAGHRLARRGEHEAAWSTMHQALQLAEDMDEPRLIGACCNNLADHLVAIDRPADGLPYARRAARVALACGARGAAAIALITAAQACEAAGLLAQATAAAHESLERNGEPPIRPSARDSALKLLSRLAQAREVP